MASPLTGIDKKLTATAAQINTAQWNGVGPRADRMYVGLPFCEQAGANLANVGYTTYTSEPTWANPIVNALVGGPSFIAPGADATNGPCIYFTEAGGEYAVLDTAGGANETYERGTLLFRFKHGAGSGFKFFLHNGTNPATTQGGFAIRSQGVAPPYYFYVVTHDGIAARSFSWETSTPGDWHTIVVTWGERGWNAYCDSINNSFTGTDGYSHSIITQAGASWEINRAIAGAVHTDLYVSGLAIWDVQLELREIQELMADPWLPFRPGPPTDDYLRTNVCPIMGRVTDSGFTGRVVTGSGSGGNLANANVNFRMRCWSDLDGSPVDTAEQGDGVAAVTDILKPITAAETGLSAGTEYYVACQWTPDDTAGTPDWYPFPGGLNRVVTRRTSTPGGGFAFVLRSDSHLGNSGINFVDNGMGVPNYEASNAWWYEFAAGHDMLYRVDQESGYPRPDFVIDLGDFAMLSGEASGTGDVDASCITNYVAATQGAFQSLRLGGLFFAIGNHEYEAGYHQHTQGGAAKAAQKQCTIARRRVIPNPTNSTYSEGGENEGTPTTSNEMDWLPDVDATYDANYRNTYVIDSLSPRENVSPLQNYYAFTWGNCLICVLDPMRYTAPADPPNEPGDGGMITRPNQEWTLGPTQAAWLENVLAGSSATWKLLCMHHCCFGAYGRGNGLELETNEFSRALLHICRKHRCIVVHGHDHTASHYVHPRFRVHFVAVPTIGGIHSSMVTNQDYGVEGSSGADHLVLEDGKGADLGIQHTLNICGYVLVHVESSAITFIIRRTSHNLSNWKTGKFLGNAYTAAAGSATLDERTREVIFAITASDLAGLDPDWWNDGGLAAADVQGTPVGDYAYDEDQANADTALAGGTSGSTYIATIPECSYEGEVSSIGIATGRNCRSRRSPGRRHGRR